MIIWIIGKSASGKTAVGRHLYDALKPDYPNLVFLDGDLLREVWQDRLGHSVEARKVNSDRICALCKMLDDQSVHVIGCVLSMFPEAQRWNRENYSSYYQVYLDVPMEELVQRDPKNIYKEALQGKIKNVVGVDIDFPEPVDSDRVIPNDSTTTAAQTAEIIMTEVLAGLRSYES